MAILRVRTDQGNIVDVPEIKVVVTDTVDTLIDGSITEVTSNVGSVRDDAFRGCSALTTANFPVATSVGNTAFYECSALTQINLPAVTSVGYQVFYECSALTQINFPAVTSIGNGAFFACKLITTANFPMVTSFGNSVFRGCSALTTAHFPVTTSIADYTFYDCSALTTANFPVATSVGYSAFYLCRTLKTADFPAVTSIQSRGFYGCGSLTAVILRNNAVVSLTNQDAFSSCLHFHGTLNSTYNPNALKDGYIYVPSALVEDYKAATNWSAFASQFRALEDYTVDGTTTGALDPNKI